MKELLNAIITYTTTEKERTLFFLLQVCYLIYVGYYYHVDHYIKKAYLTSMVLFKIELVKLLGLPKEDEVAVRVARVQELEKKVVQRRKYLGGVKDNFVQKCQEAVSLEIGLSDTKAVTEALYQKLEGAEAEWQAIDDSSREHFASHFVPTYIENGSITCEVARI